MEYDESTSLGEHNIRQSRSEVRGSIYGAYVGKIPTKASVILVVVVVVGVQNKTNLHTFIVSGMLEKARRNKTRPMEEEGSGTRPTEEVKDDNNIFDWYYRFLWLDKEICLLGIKEVDERSGQVSTRAGETRQEHHHDDDPRWMTLTSLSEVRNPLYPFYLHIIYIYMSL